MHNFESILEALGPLGRWQTGVNIWTLYLGVVVGTYLQGYNFLAAKLDHWCNVPETDTIFANWTLAQRREFSTKGSCEYYQRDYGRYREMSYETAAASVANDVEILRPCSADIGRWHYASDHYGVTVQNEWNLVCEQSYLLPTTQTVIMIGAMAGTLIFGHLADRFGRRTMVLWLAIPNLLVALATAASPSFVWFAALRFLQGGLGLGLYSTMFVLSKQFFFTRRSKKSLTNFTFFSGVSSQIWKFLCRDTATGSAIGYKCPGESSCFSRLLCLDFIFGIGDTCNLRTHYLVHLCCFCT